MDNQRDRVAGFNGYSAIAVQFDLPNPFRAFRQLWDGQAVHRLDKTSLLGNERSGSPGIGGD
jgi:hypothetical protein